MATTPSIIHPDSGIDLTAPGGVDSLIEFHRGFFGDMTMEAGDDDAGGDDDQDDTDPDTGDGDQDDADTGDDTDQDGDGESQQSDVEKVKSALRKERKEKRDLAKRVRQLEKSQRNTPKSDDGDEPDNDKIEQARREAEQKANNRIVKAELKAVAAGKLTNPALALKLIDPEQFEVDDDGEVDASAMEDAITELLEDYPELAAQQGPARRFQTKGDGGGKPPARTQQLTQADLNTMSAPEISKAMKEGRLKDLLTGKAK